MKIYVVVGESKMTDNISARAAFVTMEEAKAWIDDPKKNWFDDRNAVVELDLEVHANVS